MTTQKELEKLEKEMYRWVHVYSPTGGAEDYKINKWIARLSLIREGLGKAQGEPVAWRDPSNIDPGQSVTFVKAVHLRWPHIYRQALYAAPPADSAQVLVEALEQIAALHIDYIDGLANKALATYRSAQGQKSEAAGGSGGEHGHSFSHSRRNDVL